MGGVSSDGGGDELTLASAVLVDAIDRNIEAQQSLRRDNVKLDISTALVAPVFIAIGQELKRPTVSPQPINDCAFEKQAVVLVLERRHEKAAPGNKKLDLAREVPFRSSRQRGSSPAEELIENNGRREVAPGLPVFELGPEATVEASAR